MVFFIIILLLVIFNQTKFAPEGYYMKDEYLSKQNTTSINGIFVILIIFSHYSQYVNFEGIFDEPYLILKQHLNQMVVATFLFYSGYGMMESIKKKGYSYLETIPRKFVTLLIRFDCAVCVFWIVGSILNLGYNYNVKSIVLSFIGWNNIGNSNWYIFVIRGVYILFYLAFQFLKVNENMFILSTSVFSALVAAFVLFMIITGKDMYWYDTVILVPVGCFYSLIKDKVERIVMKNDYFYYACIMIDVGLYIIFYKFRFDYGIEGYTIWAMTFIVLVLLITMKVSIQNSILEWFGKHIFSVYILQRIPMIILNSFGFTDNHRYICLIVVIITTMFLAIVFEYITDKIFAFFRYIMNNTMVKYNN